MRKKPIIFTFFIATLIATAGCSKEFRVTQCTNPVYIIELLTSNSTGVADEDGGREDWIKIHNCSNGPVDLIDWGLSDKNNQPLKWVFKNITIQPNGYLIVWASGKYRQSEGKIFHTNFKLSSMERG
jgi:hypothetical protein